MTHSITYSTRNGTSRLEQSQLQKLAENILNYGKVISINHYGFSTNKYSKDGELQAFKNGGKSIAVEGFGFTYHIHFSGLRVTEIIETYLGCKGRV